MKKHSSAIIFLILVLVCGGVFAQESAVGAADDFFEGDIDSLFDDIPEDAAEGNPLTTDAPLPESPNNPVFSPKKIGFILDAGFNVAGSYAPGWKTAPWYWDDSDKGFSHSPLAKMESTLSLDIQYSDILRVKQSFSWAIPGLSISIPEFFLDYNLLDAVFFRAGKYTLNWGISPNFQYTNLPSRIPTDDNFSGDLYIARADIPVGIGGFQLAAMTRSSALNGGSNMSLEDLFFGLKYNVAIPIFDIDAGILYNTRQDSKAFLSLKTTLFNQLEFYAEGLMSYNFDILDKFTGSGSIGFAQDFFDSRLTINGEIYYNGEANAFYVQKENFYNDTEELVKFIPGFNTALNIQYKPSWLKNVSLFLNYLHGFGENTVQLVPAIRYTPLSNLHLYLAVPMALGSKGGYYYENNADKQNRPFSIVMMISFSGSYRYSNM